jgi:hypothetical protein
VLEGLERDCLVTCVFAGLVVWADVDGQAGVHRLPPQRLLSSTKRAAEKTTTKKKTHKRTTRRCVDGLFAVRVLLLLLRRVVVVVVVECGLGCLGRGVWVCLRRLLDSRLAIY